MGVRVTSAGSEDYRHCPSRRERYREHPFRPATRPANTGQLPRDRGAVMLSGTRHRHSAVGGTRALLETGEALPKVQRLDLTTPIIVLVAHGVALFAVVVDVC